MSLLRRIIAILSLAAVPLLITGSGGVSASPEIGLNVILISLDTLRADRLGMYGAAGPTSPHLDAFAANAVVFSNAVAESGWTLPSHATMLTGSHSATHRVVRPELRLSDSVPMLSEILRDRGYRTLAITGGGYVGPAYFDRGFDSFEVDPHNPTAPEGIRSGHFASVLQLATRRLEEGPPEQPFFAFLHTYNIHCPYTPPPPWRGLFHPEDPELAHLDGVCGPELAREHELGAREIDYLTARYDEGIRWVDDALGEFFGYLERRGLLEKTVVVITSDHGEEFLEHGSFTHGGTLYREVLMIPLIVHSPNAVPDTHQRPVGLVSVTPTILDLLGLELSAEQRQYSVAPLVRGAGLPAEHPTTVLSMHQADNTNDGTRITRLSLLSERYHLISNRFEKPGRAAPRRWLELFDTHTDPREQVDLAEQLRDLTRRQKQALDLRLAGLRRAAVEQRGEFERDEIERLRALGYLGGP